MTRSATHLHRFLLTNRVHHRKSDDFERCTGSLTIVWEIFRILHNNSDDFPTRFFTILNMKEGSKQGKKVLMPAENDALLLEMRSMSRDLRTLIEIVASQQPFSHQGTHQRIEIREGSEVDGEGIESRVRRCTGCDTFGCLATANDFADLLVWLRSHRVLRMPTCSTHGGAHMVEKEEGYSGECKSTHKGIQLL